jgi:hypothetical protein
MSLKSTPTPLMEGQLYKAAGENDCGHTIIVSDEHRLEVAVCPLPVQDERRLTDMTAVEIMVPIMWTGIWQL